MTREGASSSPVRRPDPRERLERDLDRFERREPGDASFWRSLGRPGRSRIPRVRGLPRRSMPMSPRCTRGRDRRPAFEPMVCGAYLIVALVVALVTPMDVTVFADPVIFRIGSLPVTRATLIAYAVSTAHHARCSPAV